MNVIDLRGLEPTGCASEPDPVFAALHEARRAYADMTFVFDMAPPDEDDRCDEANDAYSRAVAVALQTRPTTRDGLRSYCEFVAEVADWLERLDLGPLGYYMPTATPDQSRHLSAQDMALQTLLYATRGLSA